MIQGGGGKERLSKPKIRGSFASGMLALPGIELMGIFIHVQGDTGTRAVPEALVKRPGISTNLDVHSQGAGSTSGGIMWHPHSGVICSHKRERAGSVRPSLAADV